MDVCFLTRPVDMDSGQSLLAGRPSRGAPDGECGGCERDRRHALRLLAGLRTQRHRAGARRRVCRHALGVRCGRRCGAASLCLELPRCARHLSMGTRACRLVRRMRHAMLGGCG